MTGAVERPIPDLADRGRWWWLPREGVGNDLDDIGWAPILDVAAAAVGGVGTSRFGAAEEIGMQALDLAGTAAPGGPRR